MRFLASRLLGLLTLLGVGMAQASTLTPVASEAGDIKVLSGAAFNADKLRVRAPNAAGISLNHFDSFQVIGKKLQIMNLPGLSGSSAQANRLIVISAPSIDIRAEVEIVGPATDILFISRNASGNLSCDGCAFENAYRVTFAAGTTMSTLTDSSNQVGRIGTTSGGTVQISSLSAPGLMQLDLIGRVVDITGTVDINQRARREATGAYVNDPLGPVTIATGAVNLFNGAYELDYQTLAVERAPATTQPYALRGKIRGGAVNISSTALVNDIYTDIDTRTNLLSSIRYQGEQRVAQEAIVIQSYTDSDQFAQLNIRARLSSHEAITIQADGDIGFKGSNITSNGLAVLSKSDVRNFDTLTPGTLEIGARSFYNRGTLESAHRIDIVVDKRLINSFGGKIIAQDVYLKSKLGLVRNGAISSDFSSDIRTPPLGGDQPLDGIYGGTFYNVKSVLNAADSNASTDDSAQILATNLAIDTPVFENINPYYVKRAEGEDWSNGIPVNMTKAQQVMVSAEKNLTIKAASYILNSSAVIRINQPGVFKVDTGIFKNERYIYAMLPDSGRVDGTLNMSIDIDYFSPPGVIRSFANAQLNARTGFINNAGFVEFFKDADFLQTPNILTNGLDLSGSGPSQIYFDVCGAGRDWGRCYHLNLDIVYVDKKNIGVLFYVGGRLFGPSSGFVATDYDVMSFDKNEIKSTLPDYIREYLSFAAGILGVAYDDDGVTVTAVVIPPEELIIEVFVTYYELFVNYISSLWASITEFLGE